MQLGLGLARAGDRIEVGESRLECGDALDLLPHVPDGSVHVVATDPPYMLGALSASGLGSKTGTWADMMNSARWYAAWIAECWRVLDDEGFLWVCAAWRSAPVFQRAFYDAGVPTTSLLTWDKGSFGPGGTQGLRPQVEHVYLAAKPGAALADRSLPDVWRVPFHPSQRRLGHPAEKPVALFDRILRASSVGPGHVVLDPFAGSGTTLEAAINLGATGIGFELDGRFYKIAQTRLERVRRTRGETDERPESEPG